MITLTAMVLLASAAAGADGDPQDLRVEIARDAQLNWTTLSLEINATARGGGTESSRAVEELARREADAGVRLAAARIPVSGDRTVADLQTVPEFGNAMESRLSNWRATETRYYASGRVDVDAELSLVDLLKPYTLATARAPERPDGPQPRYTGVVIDARGTDASPAWAPRLLSAKGEVLHEGGLWEDAAMAASPVIYVSDPAHRASSRAGEDPIFLRATGAEGPDLVLSPEDSQRFKTSIGDAVVLGEGRVVVVLDP